MTKEIRDQYLDETKGAPFRQRLALELKINARIWLLFLRRCPRAMLGGQAGR